MSQVVTIREARATFFEIINRIMVKKEKIIFTKKGKQVAVVQPPNENPENQNKRGLINAVGALADEGEDMEKAIDQMVTSIYHAGSKEQTRGSDLN